MDERTGRFGGTGRVEGKGIGWNWGKMFGWRHDMVRRVVPMDGWSHHRDMDRSASERQQTMTLIWLVKHYIHDDSQSERKGEHKARVEHQTKLKVTRATQSTYTAAKDHKQNTRIPNHQIKHKQSGRRGFEYEIHVVLTIFLYFSPTWCFLSHLVLCVWSKVKIRYKKSSF